MSANYEILTLKGGQWQIDTTMKNRDDAIEHAKELFAEKRYDGVKVLKDVVDPRTNKSKEITIYDSTRNLAAKKPAQEAPAKGPQPAKEKADVDFKFKRKPPPAKKKSSDIWLILRTGILLLVLLVVAAFVLGGMDLINEILGEFGIRL
ncbi:MAG: hypothetical protein NXI16_07555 [Alphaproteobacteria bacterium]|nr:hypothetical protein [Alphaproteobacteria bacterium]